MQPEKLYFHGSIAQFWNVIYAEYQRFHASLGRAPFNFMAPNPQIINLAAYKPNNTNTIMFDFWNDEHKQVVLSIDAEYSRHKQAVWVMAFDQGMGEKQAKRTFSIWQEIKTALKKEETFRKKVGKKRKMQGRTEDSLNRLCQIRLEAIKNGRPIPKKDWAFQQAGTTYKTVQTYMRELLVFWDDKKYRIIKLE